MMPDLVIRHNFRHKPPSTDCTINIHTHIRYTCIYRNVIMISNIAGHCISFTIYSLFSWLNAWLNAFSWNVISIVVRFIYFQWLLVWTRREWNYLGRIYWYTVIDPVDRYYIKVFALFDNFIENYSNWMNENNNHSLQVDFSENVTFT